MHTFSHNTHSQNLISMLKVYSRYYMTDTKNFDFLKIIHISLNIALMYCLRNQIKRPSGHLDKIYSSKVTVKKGE